MTTATHSPKVERALADLEDAKQGVSPAVAKCLDLVGELIVKYGDPDAVFDRVLDLMDRESAEKTEVRA